MVVGDPHVGEDRQLRLHDRVARAGLPVLGRHPLLERLDELVEVVGAPLDERAAGLEPGELAAQLAAVLQPRGGVTGAPHRGVLDVRVSGCPVPPDERAVGPVAVDAQGAPILELA